MAEHNLPKVATGVRFSSPAPLLCRCSSMVERDLAKVDTAVQFRSSAPMKTKLRIPGLFIFSNFKSTQHNFMTSIFEHFINFPILFSYFLLLPGSLFPLSVKHVIKNDCFFHKLMEIFILISGNSLKSLDFPRITDRLITYNRNM